MSNVVMFVSWLGSGDRAARSLQLMCGRERVNSDLKAVTLALAQGRLSRPLLF